MTKDYFNYLITLFKSINIIDIDIFNNENNKYLHF